MKNMKKLLAVLLALVMVLSLLAGCGNKSSKKKNNDDDDDDEDKETTSETGDSTGSTDDTGSTGSTGSTGGETVLPNEENEPTEGGNNAPTEDTNTQTPPSNNVEQTEKEFDTGSVKTNTYTNTYAGIQLTLDSNWTFKTDAEIEQTNKQALGMVSGDYKEMLKNASTFTDMMATHSNETDTISVAFEKLPAAYATLSEEQYAEISKENLKGALESMGMTNVTVTVGKGAFAGEQHVIIDVSAKYYSLNCYEKMAIVKCGDYMVCVTVCSWNTNITASLLNMFKPLSV